MWLCLNLVEIESCCFLIIFGFLLIGVVWICKFYICLFSGGEIVGLNLINRNWLNLLKIKFNL